MVFENVERWEGTQGETLTLGPSHLRAQRVYAPVVAVSMLRAEVSD